MDTTSCDVVASDDSDFGYKVNLAARLLDERKVLFDNFPMDGVRYLDFYRTFDRNPDVRAAALDCFITRYKNFEVDAIAAIGGGGFGLGACVAYALNIPLHPIRKASDTVYDASIASVGMVYADRNLTLANDVVVPGSRVVLIDDTIATGGTSLGAIELLKNAGATVIEVATLYETISKQGRRNIAPIPLFAILSRDTF